MIDPFVVASETASFDHHDRLLSTAEWLVEQGLHRAASDVLMLVSRDAGDLLPLQRERLSSVALVVVGALRGDRPQPSLLRPRPLPLVWDDEEELAVC